MANATRARESGVRVATASVAPSRTLLPAGFKSDPEREAEGRIDSAFLDLERLGARLGVLGYRLQLLDATGRMLWPRKPDEDGSASSRALGPGQCAPAGTATDPASGFLTLELLAGEDPQMLRNVRSARRIVNSNVAVLIQGPTGSGKEAFAHAMHRASCRASGPFVAVNCAAIPESLIESELFGYRPGAFTGARREGLRGKILQSSGGTLFLDEIGDMPLALQTRLLRALEQRAIVPLGGEASVDVDLHVIAASHRNLRDMIACGAFREDLYYRLNGITLELPALRERADREQLVRQALAAETADGRPAAIEPEALAKLLAWSWPGNIRELRNVIRTALAICDGGVIRWMDLPREIRGSALEHAGLVEEPTVTSPGSGPVLATRNTNALQLAERTALLQVIEQCGGNMTQVAGQLGMSRNTLYRRIKRHGIPLRHGFARAT